MRRDHQLTGAIAGLTAGGALAAGVAAVLATARGLGRAPDPTPDPMRVVAGLVIGGVASGWLAGLVASRVRSDAGAGAAGFAVMAVAVVIGQLIVNGSAIAAFGAGFWVAQLILSALAGTLAGLALATRLHGSLRSERTLGIRAVVAGASVAAFLAALVVILLAAPVTYWGVIGLVASALGRVPGSQWTLVVQPVVIAVLLFATGFGALRLAGAESTTPWSAERGPKAVDEPPASR